MNNTRINMSFLEKIRKTAVNIQGREMPDPVGSVLSGKYRVTGRLGITSGEADIFRCQDAAGRRFVLKLYRRENAIKSEVLERLSGICSPCVSVPADFGIFQNHEYTITPFMNNPSLGDVLGQGTRFTLDELRNLIIPSVNEGLRELHRAGILHKDLKPANLIPDDDGQHIVIIDFGISSTVNDETVVLTGTGATLCYAAPEAVQGVYHQESDYFSFGITIFELFTGYTPFQNGQISDGDIARLASISKIQFPEGFPEELRELVLGLTYRDLTHRNDRKNPNRRWGYEEVQNWLRGVRQEIPGEISGRAYGNSYAPLAFLPYTFNGQRYLREQDLLLEMLRYPEQGIRDLGRGILSHHFGLFDEEKAGWCISAESELSDDGNHNYLVFFRLMYRLMPDLRKLYCAGREFSDIRELAAMAVSVASNSGVSMKSFLRALSVMLESGALQEFSEKTLQSTLYGETFFRLKELFKYNRFSDSEHAWIFGYLFSEERSFMVQGQSFKSPDDFSEKMHRMFSENVVEYIEYLEAGRSELEFFMTFMPDSASRMSIGQVLDDIDELNTGRRSYSEELMLRAGDYFVLGSYCQDSSSNKMPLEWLVLKIEGKKALLLSRYALEKRSYHGRFEDTSWESCDLRKWLNGEFFCQAFSRKERLRISTVHLDNGDNARYGTSGGCSTEDRVFLLSVFEAEKYFRSDSERRCLPTADAGNGGGYGNYCYWWLRTPGYNRSDAVCVYQNGVIYSYGHNVNIDDTMVRPALWYILCI
ncbi:DUF6273 domain-containing protein [Succinimonas amylolytica]|uniref:DUF6273 domain-containing protein n=1 Tax=Succinimonas amylolytica TaxID=83769 RepID=UPI00036F8718|nr:DUF6273 domain-containing protein [Succinimonas amylolytica]